MTMVRSAFVGASATLLDLAGLFLLVRVAGASPLAANVPALLLGLAAQFFGNKLFAFRDTSRRYLRQGMWFALAEIVALSSNALLFYVMVRYASVPYLAARLLGSAAVYFGLSYPFWRLIFRRAPSEPAGTDAPHMADLRAPAMQAGSTTEVPGAGSAREVSTCCTC